MRNLKNAFRRLTPRGPEWDSWVKHDFHVVVMIGSCLMVCIGLIQIVR